MRGKIFKNKSAKDLFPALFKDDQNPEKLLEKDNKPKSQEKSAARGNLPSPPDPKWFRQIVIEDEPEFTDDVPRGIILTDIAENLSIYTTLLGDLGYVVEHTNTDSFAIELISTISCSLVVYENILKFDKFEQYMRNLSGSKRRNLIYMIVGPSLRTLYDLEALSLSANAVVNSKDIKYINLILRKVYQDYDALYGPYLEVLKSTEGSRFS